MTSGKIFKIRFKKTLKALALLCRNKKMKRADTLRFGKVNLEILFP